MQGKSSVDWSREIGLLAYMFLVSYKGYRESEEQVKEWLDKSMLEREQQVLTGIESGALKEDGYI